MNQQKNRLSLGTASSRQRIIPTEDHAQHEPSNVGRSQRLRAKEHSWYRWTSLRQPGRRLWKPAGWCSSEVFQHRVKFGSLAEDPFGVIEYHVARVSQGHATRQPVQQINTASLLEI
jgi:hypothetical protein